jgi:uncharacterized membrane protein YjjB (DUF3815 family)
MALAPHLLSFYASICISIFVSVHKSQHAIEIGIKSTNGLIVYFLSSLSAAFLAGSHFDVRVEIHAEG